MKRLTAETQMITEVVSQCPLCLCRVSSSSAARHPRRRRLPASRNGASMPASILDSFCSSLRDEGISSATTINVVKTAQPSLITPLIDAVAVGLIVLPRRLSTPRAPPPRRLSTAAEIPITIPTTCAWRGIAPNTAHPLHRHDDAGALAADRQSLLPQRRRPFRAHRVGRRIADLVLAAAGPARRDVDGGTADVVAVSAVKGGHMQPVIVRAGASLRNDIEAGPHRMVADEPVSAGGTEAGPTPYDFLAAALGAVRR